MNTCSPTWALAGQLAALSGGLPSPVAGEGRKPVSQEWRVHLAGTRLLAVSRGKLETIESQLGWGSCNDQKEPQ